MNNISQSNTETVLQLYNTMVHVVLINLVCQLCTQIDIDIFPFPGEEFEDTKGAIRICRSKKDKQHHVAIRKRRKKGQTTIYKTIKHTTKDRVTRTTRVRCSCSVDVFIFLTPLACFFFIPLCFSLWVLCCTYCQFYCCVS